MANKVNFTNEELDYLKENRLKMPMRAMAEELGYSYFKIRNVMIENNLQLTKDEVQAIRSNALSKHYKEPTEVINTNLIGVRESMKKHLSNAIL